MSTTITLRLFTSGGILTPEELRNIIKVASMVGCEAVMPGSRQELYLEVEKDCLSAAEVE